MLEYVVDGQRTVIVRTGCRGFDGVVTDDIKRRAFLSHLREVLRAAESHKDATGDALGERRLKWSSWEDWETHDGRSGGQWVTELVVGHV